MYNTINLIYLLLITSIIIVGLCGIIFYCGKENKSIRTASVSIGGAFVGIIIFTVWVLIKLKTNGHINSPL